MENGGKPPLGQMLSGVKKCSYKTESTLKLNLSFSYSEFCFGGPQKLHF